MSVPDFFFPIDAVGFSQECIIVPVVIMLSFKRVMKKIFRGKIFQNRGRIMNIEECITIIQGKGLSRIAVLDRNSWILSGCD